MTEPRHAQERRPREQRRGRALPSLPPHRFALRVYYEDTDAGGIVYYANYLKFAERARTEMMRDAGIAHAAMVADSGVMFAVRRCAIDYLRPARLDDLIEVESRILAVGGATLEAEQVVRRGVDELARIHIHLACIDRRGRPARLPGSVRAALSAPPGHGGADRFPASPASSLPANE